MDKWTLSRSLVVGIGLLAGGSAAAQTAAPPGGAVSSEKGPVASTSSYYADSRTRLLALIRDAQPKLVKPTDGPLDKQAQGLLAAFFKELLPSKLAAEPVAASRDAKCLRNGCLVDVHLPNPDALRAVNKLWVEKVVPWPPTRRKGEAAKKVDLPPGWYISRSAAIPDREGPGFVQTWAIQYPVVLEEPHCAPTAGCSR